MADENTTPAAADVPLPTVVAQEAKVVGDADLTPREPTTEVVQEQQPAQVAQPREDAVDKVNVHEVVVHTDTVITDTSDPLAVQIPDAGRGTLDLPIFGLNAPTVEQVFAEHASKSDDSDDTPAE